MSSSPKLNPSHQCFPSPTTPKLLPSLHRRLRTLPSTFLLSLFPAPLRSPNHLKQVGESKPPSDKACGSVPKPPSALSAARPNSQAEVPFPSVRFFLFLFFPFLVSLDETRRQIDELKSPATGFSIPVGFFSYVFFFRESFLEFPRFLFAGQFCCSPLPAGGFFFLLGFLGSSCSKR